MKDQENQYSQLGEELIIREFFNDRRDGFYVDIGAAWGNKLSTTLYLDKELGWKGIGVDALSFYKQSWDETRPESIFLNYIVSEKAGGTIRFYQAIIPALSSVYPDMIRSWGLKVEETKHIDVESITLDDLLKNNDIKKINFLSIDAEGSEPGVLKGFTIRDYMPELVCVEAHTREENDSMFLQYFSENGYRRMAEYDDRDNVNWYFCQA